MWNRMIKRLEIIGYSRAIGALSQQHGVTQQHIDCLKDSVKQARVDLAKMKNETKLRITNNTTTELVG